MAEVDLWKMLLTTGLLALGWFLKNLSSRVDEVTKLENDMKWTMKKIDAHDLRIASIDDKFGTIEKGLTQLQVYHENDAENWRFVFEKLDKLAENGHHNGLQH